MDIRNNPIIRLGLACNLKCRFCNVPPESNELSGISFAKKIVSMAKTRSCISVSGGEPTLYFNDLIEILQSCKKKKIIVDLQTNAMLLSDKEKANQLAKAGLTQTFVSFHSHIAAIHDFLTGTAGSWEKTLTGIHNLLSLGITVNVNDVLTSVNYANISDFVIFLRKRVGIKCISVSVIQPRGRAFINRKLVPEYSLLDSPIRKAIDTADKVDAVLINPICGLPLCIGGWENCPDHSSEYMQGVSGNSIFPGKRYAVQCSACAAKKYCGGVWQEYYEIHGDYVLKPIKNLPIIKNSSVK